MVIKAYTQFSPNEPPLSRLGYNLPARPAREGRTRLESQSWGSRTFQTGSSSVCPQFESDRSVHQKYVKHSEGVADSHSALRYLRAAFRIYTGIELFNIKTKTLNANDPRIIHIMVMSVFRCSDIFYPSSGLLRHRSTGFP